MHLALGEISIFYILVLYGVTYSDCYTRTTSEVCCFLGALVQSWGLLTSTLPGTARTVDVFSQALMLTSCCCHRTGRRWRWKEWKQMRAQLYYACGLWTILKKWYCCWIFWRINRLYLDFSIMNINSCSPTIQKPNSQVAAVSFGCYVFSTMSQIFMFLPSS